MALFDYAVLFIVGISVLFGVVRGMVREVLSLASWVFAFFAANAYTAQLAKLMPLSNPSLRMLAAFGLLFFATWLVGTLVALILAKIMRSIGLGSLDRFLGAVFGLARGLLLVLALVLAAGLTSVPQQAHWKQALLAPPLERVALKLKPWLPQELAQHIRYE